MFTFISCHLSTSFSSSWYAKCEIEVRTFRRAVGEEGHEKRDVVDMLQVRSDVLDASGQLGSVGQVVEVVEHDSVAAC